MVENTLPLATEAERLMKVDNIIEIYVGKPKDGQETLLGTAPRIQLGNTFVSMDQIASNALRELYLMPEHLRKSAMVSIKADKTIKMGIILDLKEELQSINLLKINYTTVQGDVFQNIE